MSKSFAIGLMSGTSMDGLDAVLISKDKTQVKLLGHIFSPYNPSWKKSIREVIENNLLIESQLFSAVWSELASKTVLKLLNKTKLKPSRIEVIGAHGQTVGHFPEPKKWMGFSVATTIQLADLSRLSFRTKIPVVGNFRMADIAAGGQGAPLVPHAHRMLFGNVASSVAIQNMGGIGNVTHLVSGKVASAFDTGPGNIWIDTVVRWFSKGKDSTDWEGKFARQGRPEFRIIERLLLHPYFSKTPPKSTGWEGFGDRFLKKFKKDLLKIGKPNALATVTYATVLSVQNAYQKFLSSKTPPKALLVCGGGAKNLYMMELFSKLFSNVKVGTTADYGIPVDQVEAISFALLALQTVKGQPNNEPVATGARQSVVCGQIVRV